ncbi:MAG: ABC transporter ATP-binding protein, partial [Pseudomonadota bacterium]
KDEFDIAMLFISHDMAVVENISDQVAVMRLGQLVETGSRAQIFGTPQHPYTRRLMAAVPVADPTYQRPPEPRISDEPPNIVHPVGTIVTPHKMTEVAKGHFVAEGD